MTYRYPPASTSLQGLIELAGDLDGYNSSASTPTIGSLTGDGYGIVSVIANTLRGISSSSSLTIGTNKSAATLNLQADSATTIAQLGLSGGHSIIKFFDGGSDTGANILAISGSTLDITGPTGAILRFFNNPVGQSFIELQTGQVIITQPQLGFGLNFQDNAGVGLAVLQQNGSIHTTLFQSGATQTSFTIGTNDSGADLILQAGAASTAATLTSSGISVNSLAGFGDGYVVVDNSGNLSFSATAGGGGITPGTAGQIFVTNATPAATFTSLISYDTTYGRFTAGGQDGYAKTVIGPYPGQETGLSGVFFGSSTLGIYSNGSYIDLSALGGWDLQWQSGGNLYGVSGVNMSVGNTFSSGVLNLVANNTTAAILTAASSHALFSVGGNGSDYLAVLGPRPAHPDQDAMLWLLPNGGTPSDSNFALDGNGTSLNLNAISANFNFLVGGSSLVANIEGVHGKITAGGSGSDTTATMGPIVTAETAAAGLYLLAHGTSPSGSNYTIFGDGTSSYVNAGSVVHLSVSGTNYQNLTASSVAFGAAGASANIEFTHGKGTFGGSGSDTFAALGPLTGFETSNAGLWLLANGASPTSTNVALWGDTVNTFINAPNGAGHVAAYASGGTPFWSSNASNFYFGYIASVVAPIVFDYSTTTTPTISSGTSATSLTIGTNQSAATLTLQTDAATAILQFAGGTQASVSLGANMSATGHIRSLDSFIWRGRNNANTNDVSILQFSSDSIAFGASNANTLTFTSANQIAFNAGSYLQAVCSTLYVATTGGLSTIQLTAGGTTSAVDFIQCTNATITLDAATSDVATGNLTITAQSAYSSATVHLNGGDLILASGAQHGATGVPGVVHLRGGANDIAALSATTTTTVATWYDYTGTSMMTQVQNIGANLISWNTSSANTMEWLVGTAQIQLGSTYFNAGSSAWWFSSNIGNFYYGGFISAASPLHFDWTTATTPIMASGTSATQLTIGTNNSGATTIIQAGAATTVLTLTASGSPATPIAEFAGSVKYDNVALPSTPTGGPVVFGFNGALQAVGTSGTITTLAPAEPHCDICGSDFVVEYENPKYGYFMMCMKCLGDHHGDATWIRRAKKREA